jgi:hypothetical protein
VFKIVVTNLDVCRDDIGYFVVEAKKEATLVVSDVVAGERLVSARN